MDVEPLMGPEAIKRVQEILKSKDTLKVRAERLEDAIRAHRSSRTPQEWSDADARLYAMLPEVQSPQT
jgi:hypothetical protein